VYRTARGTTRCCRPVQPTRPRRSGKDRGGAGSAPDKREIGGSWERLRSGMPNPAVRKVVYEVEAENTQRRAKRVRPTNCAVTPRLRDPLGTMFANITRTIAAAFEVFINLAKAGGSAMADAEAWPAHLARAAVRHPADGDPSPLRGSRRSRVGLGPKKILSVPDAIGMALEDWWRATAGRAAGPSSRRGPAAPASREAASGVGRPRPRTHRG